MASSGLGSRPLIHLLGECDGECQEKAFRWLLWSERFSGKRPAMVDCQQDYSQLIGPKGRNMLRKAQRRGYSYGEVDFNHYLRDVHEVNTSMPVRSGRPMSAAYAEYPLPVTVSDDCPRHTDVFVGGLKDGKLMAYCWLVLCGEAAIINRIIGHRDALPDGVMNGLVAALVAACQGRSVRWINYLTIESATEGLSAFKRHVGFRPTETRFVL